MYSRPSFGRVTPGWLSSLVFALAAFALTDAHAQEGGIDLEDAPPYGIQAYVETNYQWNFGKPSNRITHFRGFDNRHNTFTLSNVALGGWWDKKNAVGSVMLQVGNTPSTYYLAEPSFGGTGATNATSSELFKYVQEAIVGYRFDVGGGLLLSAGIFLSPIGPESIPVHVNDHWSRSNLFFGLPFYHTGVKLAYSVSDVITASLGVYNGWNSVVDDNAGKSILAQIEIAPFDELQLSILYMTGIERPSGAPEGQPWRHLFDVYATYEVHSRVTLRAHVDGGFEPNAFGTSGWVAFALYGRVTLLDSLRFAMRGDLFREYTAVDAMGVRAAPISFPVGRVGSLTSTLDYRPHPNVSLRLEHRFDGASDDLFFKGTVAGDGSPADPYVPNARFQNTITVGATAWY
jgi:hypothetical protein